MQMYRDEFNVLFGKYPNGRLQAIHFEEDGKTCCVRMDMKRPVTLKRFREVKDKLKAKTGIDFNHLRVEHRIYEYDCDPDDKEIIALIDSGDIGGRKIHDKTYEFWADQNRLLIWDWDSPVYENNDGVICDDEVTLADCLC